jgi:hypothetical protein
MKPRAVVAPIFHERQNVLRRPAPHEMRPAALPAEIIAHILRPRGKLRRRGRSIEDVVETVAVEIDKAQARCRGPDHRRQRRPPGNANPAFDQRCSFSLHE